MKILAKVEIKGTKPLLINTFPHDCLSERASRSGTTGNNSEEWKRTVLMNESRELYVLQSYFLGAFKEGGKYLKVGKGNLSKKIASVMEVCEDKIYLNGLRVPPDKDLLKKDSEPVYLDVRAVVNPATKGRNLRYRIACKAGWECSFTVGWEDFVLSKENVKSCIENAGTFSGIGDGRAIGFGRFQVVKFEIQK